MNTILKNRKNKIVFLIMFMVLSLLMTNICILYADTPSSSTTEENTTMIDDISEVASGPTMSAFESAADMVYNIAQSKEMASKVRDRINTTVLSKTFAIGNNQFGNIAIMIANMLVLIYIIIAIIKESMRGDPSFDFWFKIFATMILTVFVCVNTIEIIDAIEGIGQSILTQLIGTGEVGDADKTIETIEGASITNMLKDAKDNGKGKKEDATIKDYSTEMLLLPYELLQSNGFITEKALDTIKENDSNKAKYAQCTFDYFCITKNEKNVKEYFPGYAQANTGKTDPSDTTGGSSGGNDDVSDTNTKENILKDIQNKLGEDAITGTKNEFDTLLFSIFTIIMYIFSLGFIIAIDALLFSIMIQLTIRKILAPIAFASIATEGARSSGVRYIKRFFALYLQVAIIYIFAAIFNSIVMRLIIGIGTSEQSGIIKVVMVFGGMAALVAAVSQTGPIATEVMGD